jgi:hypothetical protein
VRSSAGPRISEGSICSRRISDEAARKRRRGEWEGGGKENKEKVEKKGEKKWRSEGEERKPQKNKRGRNKERGKGIGVKGIGVGKERLGKQDE